MLTEEQLEISATSSLKNIASAKPEALQEVYKVDFTQGLSDYQIRQSRDHFGKNQVISEDTVTFYHLLYRQFASSVVILLIVAAVISFCTGDHLQGAGILVAVLINAVVGFLTEVRAKVSLEALEKIASPTTRVLREGLDQAVLASDLVPGDVVKLDAGARVPADLRIVEDASLTIDESVLTGESISKPKSATILSSGDDTSLSTIAYHGTHVLDGRGTGIVVKTGKDTSLGSLQQSLIESHTVPTPMELKLEELGKQVTVLTVVMCVLITVIGMLYKLEFWSMLEAAIALAVAAIPEGLPVVATLALAMGTQKMVKMGSLIRQLAAVETLGCTTVICSDKTGTLTQNKLMVTDVYCDRKHINVTGTGFVPEGKFSCSDRENGSKYDATLDKVFQELICSGLLCNDSSLQQDSETKEWTVSGDPTEGALIVLAAKSGIDTFRLVSENKRISELPFDLKTKRMVTINKCTSYGEGSEFLTGDSAGQGRLKAFVKGSPEVLIEASSHVLSSDGSRIFDELEKQKYLETNNEFADKGLRVLAIAVKDLSELDSETQKDLSGFSKPEFYQDSLTFLGLVGMQDKARQGVYDAIQKCRSAGIKVMMLTGDQELTALRIANDLKLADEVSSRDVLSGNDLEGLDEASLAKKLESVFVLARVNPALKLQIVRTLQKNGSIVAMTGDGVNDAPALKQANIGVAMGKTGTDLAREASNMVITDDNFAAIVSAIKEGRAIYDNIQRAICYLLTAAVASVLTVAAAIIYDGTLAMLPLQLLWLNLIMHIFPGLGIVMQDAAPGIMKRPPREPRRPIMGKFEFEQITVRSIIVSIVVLGAIIMTRHVCGDDHYITTVAFATISVSLLYQAWDWLYLDSYNTGGSSIQSDKAPINKVMYLMMAVSYLSVAVAIYLPGLSTVLKTQPLEVPELFTVFVFSTLSLVLCSAYQFIRARVNK